MGRLSTARRIVMLAALCLPASGRMFPRGAQAAPCTTAPAWAVDPANPVIRPGLNGELDAERAGAGHVIQIDDRYVMYYWGTGSDHHNRICVAETGIDRPNAWKARGAVLERQPDKDYNLNGPSFPFVLPRDDGPWLMYFCSWGKPKPGGGLPNRTGVALSDDKGRTWRYCEDNPILPLDMPYDKEATGSIWVIRDNDRYRMYYTAIGRYYPRPAGVRTGHGDTIPEIGIGYATSADGIHWTKPFDHTVVSPRGFATDPYEYIASKPCIVRNGDTCTMWVHTFGTAYRVRSLTSTDGIVWTWNPLGPSGELGTGRTGEFDAVQRTYVCVVKHGNEYRCWYTGTGFGKTGMGYATARIPLAVAGSQPATREAAGQ
jgi:hypothetical protein